MIKYGFYGRLREEFPSQIIVDATENCNYECIHCPHASYKRGDVYTGANLPLELNNKMVDEVKNYGQGITQQIRYTANGEPFLHPDIMEILGYAIKNSGCMVTLTTNGSLLTSERVSKLFELGIGLIDISIDAYHEETYKKIRRKGSFEKVRENVITALNLKKKGNYKTKIIVSYVEQEFNKEETLQFRTYWEEAGVDRVVVRKLHSAGGAMHGFKNDALTESVPCVYLWERIMLDAKGNLSFCPTSWEGKTHLCDYRNSNIIDIWNGEGYKDLRNCHLSNKWDECPVCRECPDREMTIWPGTEKAYGDMIEEFNKEN